MRSDMFNRLIYLGLLGLVLVVVGIILIFFSDNLGIFWAEDWLVKYGYADTSKYELKVNSNITNFLVTGSIFLGFGLATILLAFYKLLSIKE